MKRLIKSVAAAAGFVRAHEIPRPVAPDLQDVVECVGPYTMTSAARIAAVVDAVDYLVANRIDGDLVECGVWRGGSMMAAALRLMEHGERRELWLYDTFDGMAEPDAQTDGPEAHARYLASRPRGSGSDWCLADLEDVRANVASTGYPMDQVRMVVGKVENTIPATMPDQIGLLRLDTDWYASTRHELEHLAPKVVDGGVLLVDDYGHWDGARQAVDEWMGSWPHPVMLHRTDYTGRAAVLYRPQREAR